MKAAPSPQRLYATPISSRPKRTWPQVLNGIAFVMLMNFGSLMVNGFQLLFLMPLLVLPFSWSKRLYNEGIRYTKGSYGDLLVLICSVCGPTEISITFEQKGQGAFTEAEMKDLVVRDKSGQVVSLSLPQKSVYIANHQIYADWWYAWTLAYFMNTHKDVFIVLKASLKWIPVVGWGMQFFDFIFLARSWASDRLTLASRLAKLGKQAEQDDKPFMFLIYPEGTLVSADTQPISRKYAEKMGIENRRNMLIPKSTGLHCSLRSLAPKIPSLQLLDATVLYPGIPPMGYGQSYYTLRSIFMDRVPPPVIHMHLRKFNVAKDVPIGDMSSTSNSAIPKKDGKETIEVDIPEQEKEKFDVWLRDLWREKDDAMDRFFQTGSFTGDKADKDVAVRIPLRLRRTKDALDAFGFFLPALAFKQAVSLLKRWL